MLQYLYLAGTLLRLHRWNHFLRYVGSEAGLVVATITEKHSVVTLRNISPLELGHLIVHLLERHPELRPLVQDALNHMEFTAEVMDIFKKTEP